MKISLTKLLKLFCLLGAGLLTTVMAQAQIEFTINSPSSLAGTYTDFASAGFGPLLNGEITHDLAASDTGGVLNGCDPIGNAADMVGNIALIDRGACAFTQKVLNAQNAGAVAAIICLVDGSEPFNMGGCDADVAIPSFMITKQLCDQIRMSLPVSVTFKNLFEPPTDDIVVWGQNPGEGDFDGGLNGWTTTGISDAAHVWKWTENGGIFASSEAFTDCASIGSPTASNGAVAFDAVEYTLEINPDPVQPYPQISGELISPSIDLSNVADAQARIIQLFTGLNGDGSLTTAGALFAFSIDGGTTYSDLVPVNDDVEANESTPNPDVRRIDMPGAAGASDVRIKFVFSGDFYHWILDDIVIIERPPNSISIPSAGQAIAENYATPLGLVEPMYFGAYASNTGSNVQNNVKLEVTGDYYDESGALATEDVYTGSATLDILDVGVDSIIVFSDTEAFTPAEKGTYEMEYTLSQDEDETDPADNTSSSTFQVTSNILSKSPIDANGLPVTTGGLTVGGGGAFEYGSHFYIANGENYVVDSLTFGYSGTLAGEDVVVLLSKWVDADEDGLITAGEVERIGYNAYSYTSDDESGIFITLPLIDFDSNQEASIPLENDAHYIISGKYEGANTIFLLANTDINYETMVDASIERVNQADDINLIRWADVVESDGEWSSGGFGGANIPAMSMYVTSTMVSNEDVDIPDNAIEIYPNPVKDILTVSLEAQDTSGDWNVSLTDLAGRNVSQRTIQQAAFPLQLDVKNIPAGTYLLTFENNQQTLTKRFVKH